MAEIRLEGIEKRFPDGTQALAPLDLTIGDGELFVLVGPSGCGKSTLLEIIVGLKPPSAGEVRVDGERVTGRDPKDRNMAMVFQSYAIYPHLTVGQNLAFPLELARLPRGEIERRVREAAEILQLTELLDRKPVSLSGGQRQRVAMGRAIVRQPVAFLLDEPLSNLDAKLRVQMRTELARLQRRLGTTMVYVTHDQTEAMTLGQRIAVLRGGTLQQVGTPRELYRTPRNLFVAGFIGSPAMNLMPARVSGGRLHLPMTDMDLPEGYQDLAGAERRLTAGLRAEHLIRADADTPGVFTCRAEVVEWLGAELFLHFDVEAPRTEANGQGAPGDQPESRPKGAVGDSPREALRLVARLDSTAEVREGESLRLAIDPAGLLLFDPGDGGRIAPREDPADG